MVSYYDRKRQAVKAWARYTAHRRSCDRGIWSRRGKTLSPMALMTSINITEFERYNIRRFELRCATYMLEMVSR